MSKSEIKELLALKGWTYGQLAEALDLSWNTVARWFLETKSRKIPGHAECLVMQGWLREARKDKLEELQKALA